MHVLERVFPVPPLWNRPASPQKWLSGLWMNVNTPCEPFWEVSTKIGDSKMCFSHFCGMLFNISQWNRHWFLFRCLKPLKFGGKTPGISYLTHGVYVFFCKHYSKDPGKSCGLLCVWPVRKKHTHVLKEKGHFIYSFILYSKDPFLDP